MNENGLSKNFWIIFILIFSILTVCTAVGFYFFTNRKVEVIEKNKVGGNLVLNYSNNLNGLSIVNSVPISDAIGIASMEDGEYFDFSIDVTLDGATNVQYEISAIKDEGISTISDDDIKIYLEKESSGSYVKCFEPSKFLPIKKKSKLGSPEGSMILAKVNKTESTTDNYRLRIWLSDTALVTSGNYGIEILVNGKAK